ncbi:hypothetical protein IFO70_23045 [Phormidium tenue FACHB-886]|nr:hypothetical protein [Phormidium tenue FACHB-886]
MTGCLCSIKCCCIGFRFLRYRFYPWITLAIALLNVLTSSGANRAHAKISCMKAMSKINFAGFYGLLNDLLW